MNNQTEEFNVTHRVVYIGISLVLIIAGAFGVPYLSHPGAIVLFSFFVFSGATALARELERLREPKRVQYDLRKVA